MSSGTASALILVGSLQRLKLVAFTWYTESMNPNGIRELLRREPFEPFRIRLTGGDAYDIRDPNSVALGKSRVFVAFPDTDQWAFFAYLHIAVVESLQAA